MTFLTSSHRAISRSVVMAFLCSVVACSLVACTGSAEDGSNNRPANTSSTSGAPATPVDTMISAAYESAQRLAHAVAGRQLISDPQMHTASSERLMTAQRVGAIDELVRPQLSLTRNLEIAADGTKTHDINQIEVDATAPARHGRKLCHVTLTFRFTQHSPLASSSDLTVELVARGLDDTKKVQVQAVRVEPDLGVSQGALESSTPASIIISYNAEEGAFIASHQDHTEAPTTDQEFTQITALIRQMADCITNAFDQEGTSKGQGVSSAINDDQLRELGICIAACVITGRIPFQHPAWGASSLITTLSLDQSNQESHIVVVDAANNIHWRYHNAALNDQLMPASDTPDKASNLFILYNPGRYDGIVVLRPTKDGFDNFETLPKPDDYNARFYYAKIVDTNSDGVLEIQKDTNDCNPSCGGGKITSATFAWNGSEYAQAR